MPESGSSTVRRIALIGLMGAGKTTVGRVLAERLDWGFIDLDAEIEAHSGRSVVQLFAEGEETFRHLEQQLTAELACRDHAVLSLGGGWVTRAETVALLPADTAVFWLQVSPEEAWQRLSCGAPVRPLLETVDPAGRLRELEEQREPLYEALGVRIETAARRPNDIATDIMSRLGRRIRAPEPIKDRGHG